MDDSTTSGSVRARTWRQRVFGFASVSVSDGGWSGNAWVAVGAYFGLFFTSGEVDFDFGGTIKCTSNRQDNCCDDPSQDCVATHSATGTYLDDDGVASGAIQANQSGEGNVITFNFTFGASNTGSSAANAGVGSYSAGIQFPSGGLSRLVAMGSATWRCECH